MKSEVFRLEQVSLPPYLFDINLHLTTNEIVGLIGINALGIDQLLVILDQNIPIHYGHIYCKEQLVNDYLSNSKKRNRVVVIERESTLIDSMSVEENLFVLRKGYKKHLINYKMLSSQMHQLLAPFDLHFKDGTFVGDLSSYEKLVVQFVKASICKANLVVLKDISNFVSEQDLNRLEKVLYYFKEKGMTFLYVCNHHQEAFRFCSRCYLMQEGRIIKHLFPYQMTDEIISHYSNIFEERMESEQRQKQYGWEPNTRTPLLKCIDLIYKNCHHLTFDVGLGETVVMFDSENLSNTDLFSLFKEHKAVGQGSLLMDGVHPSCDNRKLALIGPKPYETLLFPQLPVIDNIIFASDQKIRHLWLHPKRRRAIAKELEGEFGKSIYKSSLFNLDRETLYKIVYQKILMQRPQFVCVVQPFASVDMYQRIQLISYFDAFKKKGISVLVLAVSLSDTLQIADRLLIVAGGKVERILMRNEFAQFGGIAGSVPPNPKE